MEFEAAGENPPTASSVVGIIQARMTSTRLPGKSMLPLCGKPLIQHVVERSRAARSLAALVVAVPASSEDDRLAEFVRDRLGVPVVRGSRDDVLQRFCDAIRATGADVVVRITADDPLKDPRIIDECVALLRAHPEASYASNTLTPTYPEGLDVEVFRAAALLEAEAEATRPSDREHVTPFLWRNRERFGVVELCADRNRSHWRWTLDTPEDAEFLVEVLREIAERGLGHDHRAAVDLLESSPDLLRLMPERPRNEGYQLAVSREDGGS